MKVIILFLISCSAFAQNYLSTSYYGEPPQKFRVEMATSYDGKCVGTKLARKIIFDSNDELREIAIFRSNGKMEEAGPSNKPKLRDEVDEIFARTIAAEAPCLKKVLPAPVPNEETTPKNTTLQ